MSSVHLIVNPIAGHGKALKVADRAAALIGQGGIEVHRVAPDSAANTLEAIRATGIEVERLIAVGGDGLVHHMVNVAVELGVPLGLIGGGTGNDFVLGLGLPQDIEGAVDAALSRPAPVDLIRVGDRYVASVVAIGFPADVNRRANSMTYPKGSVKYTLATLIEIWVADAVDLLITVDGQTHEGPASIIAVGNSEFFGGGMKVCPGADPADGELELMIVRRLGPLSMLALLPRVFKGGHLRHRAVSMVRGKEFGFEMPESTEVWGDGEYVSKGPTTIRVAPGAVQICGYRP